MSIASEINRIKNAKSSIKEAIENKGVIVEDGTIDTYATKINDIETGITPSGTINITSNGTYDVTDKATASVSVSYSLDDYFGDTLKNGNIYSSGLNMIIKRIPGNITVESNMSYAFYNCSNLNEIPLIDTSNVTNMSYAFYNCSNLNEIPLIDTSNVTNMSYAFSYCRGLLIAPQLNTSNVTNINGMFETCEKLQSIPLLDLSNVIDMTAMFRRCNNLENIPLFDTSNVTSMSNTFLGCVSLTTFPQLDTSNVTAVGQMLGSCTKLTTVPLLNAEKMNSGISSIFEYDTALINLGGLKDLGKGYSTTQNANYSGYKLNLSYSSNLTHDSLMNIINYLYDIATAGVKTQQLILGNTNLEKLTDDEIAIATNKGWVVS